MQTIGEYFDYFNIWMFTSGKTRSLQSWQRVYSNPKEWPWPSTIAFICTTAAKKIFYGIKDGFVMRLFISSNVNASADFVS